MIVLPDKKPILVVDDNEADRHLMTYVFRRSGLQNEVRLMENGPMVVTYMDGVSSGQELAPSLILLDVNMPGITGFEVLTHLRSQLVFATLPVIVMLSSSDAEADKIQAIELGADQFLVKQSGLNDFVTLIDANFRN